MEQGARSESMSQSRFPDGFRYLRGEQEYVTYRQDSTLRVWYADTPWHYDPHWHSAVEIILVLEGTVTYIVRDTVYEVRKGEVLIVPPESLHELSMGEDSRRYLYLFEPEPIQNMRDINGLSEHFQRPFHLRDGSDAHVRIRELLLKIQGVYEKREQMWNALCYSYFLRIYTVLGQRYLSGVRSRTRIERSVDSEVVNAAMTYINSHYMEDLSLEDVSGFAGFSRYYFSRSFKKHTGRSFKDYLIQKRLQVAMDLLIQTNMQMKDVAQESGFGSVATFNRVFRENKGCTPTQYRAIYGSY